jgi:hypothetical protein
LILPLYQLLIVSFLISQKPFSLDLNLFQQGTAKWISQLSVSYRSQL